MHNSLRLRSACLTAASVWTNFQKNRSHASIHVDTRSAGYAFVRSSYRRLSHAASRFCAQRAPRTGEATRKRPEVSQILGISSRSIDLVHRRDDMRVATPYRNHGATLRDLDRHGDIQYFCSPTLLQVSEWREDFKATLYII